MGMGVSKGKVGKRKVLLGECIHTFPHQKEGSFRKIGGNWFSGDHRRRRSEVVMRGREEASLRKKIKNHSGETVRYGGRRFLDVGKPKGTRHIERKKREENVLTR